MTARQIIAAKLWSAEDDASKSIAIEKQLRGKATLFVHGLPEGSKMTVTALHEALTKKYVNPRAIQSYALAFDQATQQPRKELNDFLLRLQRMVRLGFHNSTENDARVTRRFISGINSDTVRFRLLEKSLDKSDGQYEWTGRGTPFGLSGASSFQRLMTAILGELSWNSALAYLDDVIVWSVTWEEHLHRLRDVFDKFRKAGMKLNAEKCRFGQRRIEFLGHVISSRGLEIDAGRVADLQNIARPTTVTELRKAIGAFSYLQRYIPGFADIAKSLYQLTEGKKNTELKWTKEHDDAFLELKRRVTEAPCLKLPDFTQPFWLTTDASNVGIGSQLSQMDNGVLRPVAFFSRTLRKHERNYTTTSKELLAVVESIKKFRIYLQNPFTLITDHRAIRWLNSSLDPEKENGRLGRWISYLQSYRFTIVHKPGTSGELSMADYLSRAQSGPITAAVNQAKADGMATITSIFSPEEFLRTQKDDLAIQQVKWAMLTNTELGNEVEPEAKLLWRQRQKLHVGTDGILRIWNYAGRSTKSSPLGKKAWQQVVVPKSLRRRFLQLVHDAPVLEHLGRDRTLERVRQTAYWPSVIDDVSNYCIGRPRWQLQESLKSPYRRFLATSLVHTQRHLPVTNMSCKSKIFYHVMYYLSLLKMQRP